MPESARAGTPTWVDVSTDDLPATISFYGSLFGWEAETVAPPEAGDYTMFRLGGRDVAAAARTMAPGQPVAWQVYVATDDADATADRARAAGGDVLFGPMDVFDSGRMAVLRDPAGAAIAVWQAGAHHGAELMHVPNTFAWTELSTRGADEARRFYPQVFGWTFRGTPMGEGMPEYTEFQLDGTTVAGLMPMSDQVSAQVPPHWLAYFAVDDVDTATVRATELGASLVVPGTTFPAGRFSVVSDPRGATFGLLRLVAPAG